MECAGEAGEAGGRWTSKIWPPGQAMSTVWCSDTLSHHAWHRGPAQANEGGGRTFEATALPPLPLAPLPLAPLPAARSSAWVRAW